MGITFCLNCLCRNEVRKKEIIILCQGDTLTSVSRNDLSFVDNIEMGNLFFRQFKAFQPFKKSTLPGCRFLDYREPEMAGIAFDIS